MPRPQKLKNPRAIVMHVEADLKEEWDKLRGRLSWGEFFSAWYLRQKEVIEAVVKIAALEKENEELRKANAELKELVERLKEENERLHKKLEGRSLKTFDEGKLLRQLAEHAREGISWADLCAEVLDIRDDKKMKRLMQLAFEVKTTKKNTYATRFYPKRTAPEFKGWVLVRPEKSDGPVLLIDYILYREDTLKAAKGLAVGEAVKEKVPEVKPLRTGKAAERWIEVFFELVHREYMSLIAQKRGKDAKKYLEEKVPPKLEKVLADIDPTDWRRAILAVLEEHEEDWGDVFVSNLRRVALRALNEFSRAPVMEVKADV